MESKEEPLYEEEEKEVPTDNPEQGKTDEKPGESIEDLKKTIKEYEEQVSQIDQLIEQNHGKADKIAELELLKKEVQKAIDYSADLIKLKESDQGKIKISMRTLSEKDKGKVCEGFFESEQQWFAGTIINVDVENQTAEVDWIGYTDKSAVPAKFIKIAKHPDPSQLAEGYFCESLYTKDGCWYPCMIERIFEDEYLVKFKKYGNKETVPLQYLRLKPEDVKKNKEKEKEGLENFVIPEKLKLKSTDTEEQRQAKRKKVKAVKLHHKRKIIEKSGKEKQESWLNFQHKANRSKKSHSTTAKESIFKTPDTFDSRVGVVRSGMGTSKDYQKKKHTEYHGSLQTPDYGYKAKRSKYD